jgi:hypothetical protein
VHTSDAVQPAKMATTYVDHPRRVSSLPFLAICDLDTCGESVTGFSGAERRRFRHMLGPVLDATKKYETGKTLRANGAGQTTSNTLVEI